MALNCTALAEPLLDSELFGHENVHGGVQDKKGLFQAANGGTLFLDEIGDLPAAMQVKLLRVLQEKEVLRVGGRTAIKVDVRIVAATHRDLEAAVEKGSFRRDLYYRIGGFPLFIPPLRDRRGEIAKLASTFIAGACAAARRAPVPVLSEEALRVLEEHDWPGNIRELRNAVERAVVLCTGPSILREHLDFRQGSRSSTPPPTSPPRSLPDEQASLAEKRIREALARVGGNQTKAAEILGISRRTLVTRLGEYDLPRPRSGRRPAMCAEPLSAFARTVAQAACSTCAEPARRPHDLPRERLGPSSALARSRQHDPNAQSRTTPMNTKTRAFSLFAIAAVGYAISGCPRRDRRSKPSVKRSKPSMKTTAQACPQRSRRGRSDVEVDVHRRGRPDLHVQRDGDGLRMDVRSAAGNLLNDDGKLIGTHFIGPTWQGNDGSSVVGAKTAAATSTRRPFRGSCSRPFRTAASRGASTT